MAFWNPLFSAYFVVTNVHCIIFMVLIPCYEASTEIPRAGNCTNSGKVDLTTFISVTATLGVIIVIITSYFTYKSHTERRKLDYVLKQRGDLLKDFEPLQQSLGMKEQQIETLQQSLGMKEQQIDKLQKEIDNRKNQFKSVWKTAPLYPDWRKEEFEIVNVTLDELTAHPNLLLSEKKTQVTWQEQSEDSTNSIERFDSLPAVLGRLPITKGRAYWEVEVGNAQSWDLGVCRNDVTRKGRVVVSPQNGFWVIMLYTEEYWALSSPATLLTMKEKPHRVGIFLDIEAGDVSFYDMTHNSHMFSFTKISFHGTLRPFFRLRSSESGSLNIVKGR